MQLQAYQAFIEQLQDRLRTEERVIGLILLGSTANKSHPPDQWSDHDFFVIVESGFQEQFRQSQDWLPDNERIVLAVRETEHGLKVLYDDGHLLEFAIFDLEELASARVSDYQIALDSDNIQNVVKQTTIAPEVYSQAKRHRDMGMVLCLLVVGTGRILRGEKINGQLFIRTYTLGHLLPLLVDSLPARDKSLLDPFDPSRRFEEVYPQAGEEINIALSGDPRTTALGLLDIYEKYLQNTPGYSHRAVKTVREYLKVLSA